MADIRAIEGVHNTLVAIATNAVAGLTPRPTITVGPLDRDDEIVRLNWFLYLVRTNPAYRNMEPPQTGTRTARGRPPLALELDYVLTSHPGALTLAGEQPQFADRGLAAVMQALHERAIIAEGDPLLAPEAAPLVEPLRITMESLDLDAISKVWTAASRPARTAVGYRVSLAIVESTQAHVPGPPVRERRIGTAPSIGPRFEAIAPARASAATTLDAILTGAIGMPTFALRRERDDPAGPDEWPLTATPVAPGRFSVQIAPDDLAPGVRRLSVETTVEGLPFGGDSTAVTLVPTVLAATGPVAPGATSTLTTAHAGTSVEVFIDGAPVDAGDVTVVSPTQVDVVVPAGTSTGTHGVMLRSAFTAGPEFSGLAVA